MPEKNINEINQSVEGKSTLNKSPKYVAAIAWLSLMTQVQAQQVLDEVKNPQLLENNTSSLVLDSCERKIPTDVISIKNSDGKEIAKTLERDENPELTEYNLSDLSIVSNYDFEDKMYLHSEQTMTVNENHPGSFSNVYNIASFYTSNHVWIETPCDPEKDGKTVDRWEQKIISFDNMNDRDKELYFRVLNTVFVNAKIKHTGGDLPDNMSRHKLEHIVTGISSIATRQLAIPNVNTEIKQPLEKSSNTVSKYNLNIITELAYIENLLMGSTPKVIDRWDGVLYAIPRMSQNFMDFLATRDAEGNQFMTTEQINSILAIIDQLNKLSVVEAVESVDYVKVQEKFVSYFKNDKIRDKYNALITELPSEIQTVLLDLYTLWNNEFGKSLSDKDKHNFVLNLFKIAVEISETSWKATWTAESLISRVTQITGTQFEGTLLAISNESDSIIINAGNKSEKKYQMQVLLTKKSQEMSDIYAQNAERYAQNAERHASDKEDFDKLSKIWEKIKLVNNK